jgi:hypothetical protein
MQKMQFNKTRLSLTDLNEQSERGSFFSLLAFCFALSFCLFIFLMVFGVCVCVLFCLERTDLSLVCFQVFLLSDADLRACLVPFCENRQLHAFPQEDASSNGASGSASEPKQMSVSNHEFFHLDSLLYCSAPSLFFLSRQGLLEHTHSWCF